MFHFGTNALHSLCALKEELSEISVVAKFATTAADGKVYQVEYYNLDMVLSIGYRVKSSRGVEFRQWANKVLKEYLLKGYSVNRRLTELEHTVEEHSRNIIHSMNRYGCKFTRSATTGS